MKRVRLFVGAAGLAPVGIVMPLGVAQAGTPVAGHAGHGKVHSGHAKSVRMAPAASSLNSPDVGSGCVGSVYQQSSSAKQKLWFWSAYTGNNKLCIGTVEDNEWKYVETGVSFRLRIWSRYNASHQRIAFSHTYGGTLQAHSISVVVPVHQEFGSPNYPHVVVCGAWLPPAPQTTITVCKTVTI